ncbi:MAG: acetyltransferase [Planctomycetota bacterium]
MATSPQIVIVGAGGHGKVVLDIVRAAGRYKPVGFVDADERARDVGGLPVLGDIRALPKLAANGVTGCIIAIGGGHVRRSYAEEARDANLELVNAVHPAANVSPTATLGVNVVVAAGATVCTEATLADSVIVNTNAVVDHECRVDVAAHIAPGALLAGRVTVGVEAFVGMGAKVIQCLSIGERATVGAGAVVVHDVPAGVTVLGVPARRKSQ